MNLESSSPSMWTLESARALVAELQPLLHTTTQYHVALGGGVLNRGESAKDLDLYFLPFDQSADMPKMYLTLLEKFGEAYTLGTVWGEDAKPHYAELDAPWASRHTFYLDNGQRRIDAFILGPKETNGESIL